MLTRIFARGEHFSFGAGDSILHGICGWTGSHCDRRTLCSTKSGVSSFGIRLSRTTKATDRERPPGYHRDSEISGFKISEVVKTKYDGDDTRTIDYAVMRVDRKIPDHLPLPLDTETGVAE